MFQYYYRSILLLAQKIKFWTESLFTLWFISINVFLQILSFTTFVRTLNINILHGSSPFLGAVQNQIEESVKCLMSWRIKILLLLNTWNPHWYAKSHLHWSFRCKILFISNWIDLEIPYFHVWIYLSVLAEKKSVWNIPGESDHGSSYRRWIRISQKAYKGLDRV